VDPQPHADHGSTVYEAILARLREQGYEVARLNCTPQ